MYILHKTYSLHNVVHIILWRDTHTVSLQLYCCFQRTHPEEGHMNGRNMLVTIIQ